MPSTHTDGGPAAPTPEVAMLRPEQHGVAMVTAGAPHHLPGPTLVGNSVADGYPSISHDFGDGDNHGQNDSVPSPSTSPTVEFPAATHHQHGMVVATPAERVVDAFIAVDPPPPIPPPPHFSLSIIPVRISSKHSNMIHILGKFHTRPPPS
eukprot:m.191117 g.191117  ORF g.191117 m.191117 type:complete len:151 (-) comp24911_c0_seq1:1588-2040(-)